MNENHFMAGHGSIDPVAAALKSTTVGSFYKSPNDDFTIIQGDCVGMMNKMPDLLVDMVFADPPYFLSGNGRRGILKGEVVEVDKGEWDKSLSPDEMDAFNLDWLTAVKGHMKEEATIWISCSRHNFASVYRQLEKLGFNDLNVITWEKTNPAPLLSCRCFKHSTEFIIWARKSKKVAHYFDYCLMKALNDGKQMSDVWRLPSVQRWEKSCGKHPTQKPLGLLSRIIQAGTKPGDLILDPFNGSGSTGIAASLLNRNYIGIEKDATYLTLSKVRREELEDISRRNDYLDRLIKSKMILPPVLPVPTSPVKDIDMDDDSVGILKAC